VSVVELNWSIDDRSIAIDSTSNLQELDLNDATSAEKVQELLDGRGRHLAADGVNMQLGGHWSPINCTARHNIAVIVPYRGRPRHLDVFVNYIHPFLQRQLIEYTIYVVEQVTTVAIVCMLISRGLESIATD
jgi:N-terminal region of glycosyl transferase group 7